MVQIVSTYIRYARSAASVAAAMAALGITACVADQPPPEPATASTAQPLAIIGTRWFNGAINICYETGTAFDDGSGDPNPARSHANFGAIDQAIRAAANQWASVANIYFYGYNDCPSRWSTGNPHTVAIHFEDGNNDNCGVGDAGSVWTRCRLNASRMSTPADFTSNVLHELGHVLGAWHELDRSDNGSSCRGDGWVTGNFEGTPYDPSSIMNWTYCAGVPGTLSPWDIVGIQNAYGHKLAGSLVGVGNDCLDVPVPNSGGQGWAQVYNCHGGSNQVWTFSPGTVGEFSVLTSNYGTVVDVPAGSGSPGQRYYDNVRNYPDSANQAFRMSGAELRGLGERCIDVPAWNFVAGQYVQAWDCWNGTNQQWDVLSPQTWATTKIRLHGTSLCLTPHNGSWASGTLVELQQCSVAVSWQLTRAGEIEYGGQCVDVQTGDMQNGRPLALFGCKPLWDLSKYNQQWHLAGTVTGANGLCMDIPWGTGSGQDRAAAQQYTCHGGANQQWSYYWN